LISILTIYKSFKIVLCFVFNANIIYIEIAVHTMHGCKMIGMPECDVLLAQCTTYLARAPKSRLIEDALRAAQKVVAEHKGPQPGVPLYLRNASTKLMKDLGYYIPYLFLLFFD
jgi:putative ATPase